MISYFTGRVGDVVDIHDLGDINRELAELSSHSLSADETTLRNLSEQANTYIILARTAENFGEKGFAKERGRIVGMLLVNFLQKWNGRYGYIDDVVVRSEYRGKKYGIADALLEEADTLCKNRGAMFADLTCGKNPERDAAHRVYQRCGFLSRNTVPYRKIY